MRNTTLLLFVLFVMYEKSFAQPLLQKLPFINQYSISFQQSSYDKTGLNIDCITPEDPNYYDLIQSGISANRREYVVSHIMGPAILERFWLITYPPIYVDARFRFYFDGETTPRINKTFNELFVSQEPPFEKPLVQEFNEASGGNYSYIRMPVAESLMITVDTPGLYYQFQARQLPRDTVIESWTPATDQNDLIQEFLNAG
ncbi:MAG: DUF2961 domain-containing protein [Chitinophagales bacterium]|nr:DUF2961 domain-containing protein [Chitinophagales bacterium]